MPERVNGDAVIVNYGDQVITLPERLELEAEAREALATKQAKDALLNRRLAYAAVILIALHTFLPTEQFLPILLKFIGL